MYPFKIRINVLKTTVDGEAGYLAYRPIPGTALLLATFQTIGSTSEWTRPYLLSLATTFLAILLILAILIFFLNKYIVAPIGIMSRDILAIPIEPEMGYRIPVRESDTFNDLKMTINGLLEKLHQYFEQIRADQNALKDHVALRDSMLAISQSASRIHDMQMVYNTILANSIQAIKSASLGTIMIKEGDNLKTISYTGYLAESIEGFSIPIRESFLY